MLIIYLFYLRILFHLHYLIYQWFNLPSLLLSMAFHSKEHPTGLQSCPAVCSPKGVTFETHFSPFWYIGWKPGRKFRSRIQMDGSAVCTRDTTPRTEMGLKCGFAFLSCLINFFYLFSLFCYLFVNRMISIIV